jgi:hypothetical protein
MSLAVQTLVYRDWIVHTVPWAWTFSMFLIGKIICLILKPNLWKHQALSVKTESVPLAEVRKQISSQTSGWGLKHGTAVTTSGFNFLRI